jgi:hypothetical protein
VAHAKGRRAAEIWFEHGIEGAEPAQHRRRQAMRGGSVAGGHRGQFVEGDIERAMALQNFAEQKVSAGAGRIRRWGMVWHDAFMARIGWRGQCSVGEICRRISGGENKGNWRRWDALP